jgi:hypothetical protein
VCTIRPGAEARSSLGQTRGMREVVLLRSRTYRPLAIDSLGCTWPRLREPSNWVTDAIQLAALSFFVTCTGILRQAGHATAYRIQQREYRGAALGSDCQPRNIPCVIGRERLALSHRLQRRLSSSARRPTRSCNRTRHRAYRRARRAAQRVPRLSLGERRYVAPVRSCSKARRLAELSPNTRRL